MKLTDKLWKRIVIVVTIPVWFIPFFLILLAHGVLVLMCDEVGPELKSFWGWLKKGPK